MVAKNMNHMMAWWLMAMAVALPLSFKGATAAEYVVGDSLGWTVPPNTSFYSDWAANKTFQLGDVVVFNWTGNQNVGEVSSKEEYDNCSDPGIWIGSPVNVKLIANGSRFFICTIGDHCEQGQKVILTVGSPTNTSSFIAPAPEGSHVSSLSTSVASLFGIVTTLLLSFFTYM